MNKAALLGALFSASAVHAIAAPAFCLFELPPEGDGSSQRFVNLNIVQYVELNKDELLIAYGGGNLGDGHRVRIAFIKREEGMEIIRRLKQTADECGAAPSLIPPAAAGGK